MELKVYRQDGSETGRTVELDPSVFEITPNDHVLWLDTRSILANARQGTHKAKERSETAGSTRKLYRQKGTGGARAGDAKSPTRRSGGTIFGPRPHKYNLYINKRTKQLARRSALAYKAQADAIKVVEDFVLETPNTKTIKQLAQSLGVSGRVLLLTGKNEPSIYRSGRNIERLEIREARLASSYDLLKARTLVVQESALNVLSETLGESK